MWKAATLSMPQQSSLLHIVISMTSQQDFPRRLSVLSPIIQKGLLYFPVKYPYSHGQQDTRSILTDLSTRLNKCPDVGI